MIPIPDDRKPATDARLLEVFADSLGDAALVLLAPDGAVTSWSAAAERVEGYPASEIVGRPFATFFPADDQDRGRPAELLAAAARDGRAADQGWRVRRDGSRYWASSTLTRLADAAGILRGFARVVRDATQEHATTAALRESEERFRTMANCAPVLLWMAGTDALCYFFNQFWLDFSGRSMAEEMGNGWAEGVHPEDFQQCMHTFMTAFVAHQPFAMEYRLRRADGAYRWIYDQGVPRLAPDGTFAGYIGSCVDITELREARDLLTRTNEELEVRISERTAELRARLSEREVLLREIHHRVKNNLQLISSLLNMQSRQVDEPSARQALIDCQGRVQTIAHIHERLYQSQDLGRIPFAQYARDLVTNVFHATGASTDAIALHLDLEDIELPLDRALPCGLILNELITNAVKHGFPAGRTGAIHVNLTRVGTSELALRVRDDGVGLPPEFDIEDTSTLGMLLVLALADQLDGALHVEREGGAGFRLTFPHGADDDA